VYVLARPAFSALAGGAKRLPADFSHILILDPLPTYSTVWHGEIYLI